MTQTTPGHPQGAHAPPVREVRALAAAAIGGQALLLATAWLLPVWSQFSLVGDNISELVLGRYGYVQTAAFLVAGLGTVGLAYAIRASTTGSWGSVVGSLLIAGYGAGAILSAVFPTDRIAEPADVWPQSTTGTVHLAVSLVAFPCMIVGMFVLTRTFLADARWRFSARSSVRSFARWSVFLPAGALALAIVQGEGPLVGLLQRLFVSVIATWLVLVALCVRTLAAPVPAEAPRQTGLVSP